MLTALLFIIVLSILVLVHEFGHFYIAKKQGMRVEEFGIGFPPRIIGIKKGGTVYSINWILFGGFVKVFGEQGEGRGDPRSFASKSVGQRAKTIAAGVVMNLVLAAALLIIANAVGLRIGLLDDAFASQARDVKIQIIQINSDSPASRAGLKSLDEIIKIEAASETIEPKEVKEVQEFTKRYAGQNITLTIARNDELIDFDLVSRSNPPPGQGALGVSLAKTGVVSFPWYEAIWRGVYDTGVMTANIAVALGIFFKNIFTDSKLIADVSGPVGIAVLTGQAAGLGINYLIQFVALLSINLAILNIIPFPALDGGRLLFLGIEKLKGSPVSRRIEVMVNTAGFALLITFMIWITVRDVVKLF